jgi:hypothetical protein
MTRLAQLTLALTIAVAACGGSSNTTPVVAPTGTVSTETFTGTVPLPVAGVLQSDVHNFTVAVGGSLSVTLVSAGPPPTIIMGLGIGNPSSTGTCAFLSGGTTTTSAGSTAQLSGPVAAGTYCVAVVDIGNELQPVAYTVTVAHT